MWADMERLLVRLVFLYILGLILGYYLGISYLKTGIAAIAFFFLFLLWPKASGKAKGFLLLGVIVLLAMTWLGWNLQIRQESFRCFYDHPIFLKAWVIQEPEQKENGSFTIVESLLLQDPSGKVDYTKEKILLFCQETASWQPGQIIEATVFLQPLPLQRNPGDFSYGLYLASQGIVARANLTPNGKIEQIGQVDGLISWAYRWKRNAQERIESLLLPPFSSLVQGIVFGQAEVLPAKIKEDFQRVGLTHVLAASGQNMVIITALFIGIGHLLLLPRSWIVLLTIIFMIFYTLASGGSPSVVRAVIMAVVLISAPLLDRKRDLPTSLALAAGLILLYQPLALWNISFQLSFAAVLALFIFTPLLQPALAFLPQGISGPLAVAGAIQLGVVPLTVYYFNQWSAISFFANLLILPFLEVVLVIGLLLGSLGLLNYWIAKSLAGLLWLLLKMALGFTSYLASLPWAMVELPGPQGYLLIFYYLALGALVFICLRMEKKKFPLVIWGLSILIVLAVFTLSQQFSSTLRVAFLDVGQGDAIFIQAPGGERILLDGGGQPAFYKRKVDIGEKIVVPFLLKQGVGKLDLILVSHFHEDHVGGLISVLQKIKVSKVMVGQLGTEEPLSRDFWQLVEEKKIPYTVLQRGQILRLRKGVSLQVLHPGQKPLVDTHSDDNNNSMVVKLIYGKASFLLVGDLEAEGEQELIKEMGDKLSCGVLKVGHHGSQFSSQADFLAKVRPELAVISVGAKNSFGHPSVETLERLRKLGAQVYRTDRQGGIVLETRGLGYRVKTTKKENFN